MMFLLAQNNNAQPGLHGFALVLVWVRSLFLIRCLIRWNLPVDGSVVCLQKCSCITTNNKFILTLFILISIGSSIRTGRKETNSGALSGPQGRLPDDGPTLQDIYESRMLNRTSKTRPHRSHPNTWTNTFKHFHVVED